MLATLKSRLQELRGVDTVTTLRLIMEDFIRFSAANPKFLHMLTGTEETLDHLIGDTERLTEVLTRAVAGAQQGLLITVGITPTSPETGYGYLQCGDVIEGPVRRVAQFKEKPSLEVAAEYVEAGCLWNAGMFVWRVDVFLAELQRQQPELHAGLLAIAAALLLSSRLLGGRMDWARAFAAWSPHELTGITTALQANLEVGFHLTKGWVTRRYVSRAPRCYRLFGSSARSAAV